MNAALKNKLIKNTSIKDIPEAYRPIVDIVGVEKFVELAEYARGDRLYFPKTETILKQARNRYIKEQYNGRNTKELAAEFDITVQQIASILKDAPVAGQYSLFDGYLQAENF